jgi:glycosyltransferase involved in cell wall biosynthesis
VRNLLRDTRVTKTAAVRETASPMPASFARAISDAASPNFKTDVTIIVPCFNEELGLANLYSRLLAVKKSLGQLYSVSTILVDDGSTDKTGELMQTHFANDPDCVLLQQAQNQGLAAAILRGIRTAKTEVVCSIDSDCTYDPEELHKLLPLLTTDVDLVTGSPYHPLGEVRDVPQWRLALSKTASSLYRRVLKHKLYTYTSCFRVYRRSAILRLDLRENGFLGVAELLGKLELQGSKIVECPTTLGVRVQGVSKMRTARVMIGHIFLLGRLLAHRGHQKLFG